MGIKEIIVYGQIGWFVVDLMIYFTWLHEFDSIWEVNWYLDNIVKNSPNTKDRYQNITD